MRRSLLVGTLAASLLAPAASASTRTSPRIATSRTFVLGTGRVTRTFTLRERSGVILRNRITVPDGVRVTVEALLRAPALNGLGKVVAGVRVTSWKVTNDPALSCRRAGTSRVCTQGEEACPMPAATWHFRLVKSGGPGGTIRFDYLVAPPPGAYRWQPVPWSSVLPG